MDIPNYLNNCQLMGMPAFYTPEPCKLSSVFNYSLWHKYMMDMISEIKGMKEYLEDPSETIDPFLDAWSDRMLRQSVKEEVLKFFMGIDHFGKSLYKAIKEEYGEMSDANKIDFVFMTIDSLKDENLSLENRKDIHNRLRSFYETLSEKEVSALKTLEWMYWAGEEIAKRYRNSENPVLDIKRIDNYIKRFADRSPKSNRSIEITPGLASLNQYLEELIRLDQNPDGSVPGTSRVWTIQCYNCYGLGHTQTKCSSPRRDGPIPDLEKKMERALMLNGDISSRKRRR
ncbi:uncharacterized protein KGF55_003380 [Candida pseudojiufengensis]|uniref:uncharacterized protein n=1 Tax=Candida pseudojiufengensis TaxID=497109 RepID=UPI0022247F01|nr:uncharacterized protein KGF55_003380 [Candida pseudojiufengensis]KAI5962304.1 hypothetical protein KGF55_003380 [Candida pseudojiufengensis]